MKNNDTKITGLTKAEVNKLKDAGHYNKSIKAPTKSIKEIIKSNTLTYFNLVFFVLAILLIITGSFRDLTFVPVILTNMIIGIVQEIRSKRVLDKLNILNAPRATVIRDGKEITVNAEDLVLNDIVVFSSGNQICADATVIDGKVAVNESLLTGESDEIEKVTGSDLLSGSFIVSGKCYARLTKVGEDSYISKLTLKAKVNHNKETSEIIRSLNKLVKIAGIAIIPIGSILFFQSFFLAKETFKASIQAMVASVIGMIPEGLFLLSSVTLAISAMRLAKSKVLLHDMKSIETLARVDVLCVDKTGTITDPSMEVESFIKTGECKLSIEDLKVLISDFAVSQAGDNITMLALKKYFTSPSGKDVDSISGFSSEFKYSAVNFKDGTFVLGAPEFLLKENYSKHKNEIEKHSKKGYRVLLFGEYSEKANGKALKNAVKPLAYIILSNPIRENAKETFAFFKKQGVEIKVISGDNPLTVSEVASKAGIAGAEKYIDASTLDTEEKIEEAILKYTVFGRVNPEQKRKFVKYLQKHGHTVAMTGDGVNDVLALKDADCSVAMSSGSEAARNVSQVVLLESDFSKMPEVVREGRQVVNNLERSGSLFIVKNIFSFCLSVIAIIGNVKYPLMPAQISLISMFTIGIPAFFLSQIPNNNLIKGKFISNILVKAIPGGIIDTVIIAAMVIFGRIFEVTSSDISSASTILLAIIGIMVLYNISKPMDKYKWIIWGGCAFCLFLAIAFFKDFFSLTSSMSIQGKLLCINFAIISEVFLRYLTLFVNFINNSLEKYKGYKKYLNKTES